MQAKAATNETTSRFMEALQAAEQSGSLDELIALFSNEAEVTGIGRPHAQGRDGAEAFWRNYLAQFDTIRSTFTQVLEGPDHGVLEWTSVGALSGGHPISYSGVSILQWRDGQIHRFRTYYDSAAFLTRSQHGSSAR